MKKATVSKLSFLSVMSLYLVYLGTAEISPALATLAQHFTGKNVTWISTVPSLFLVIGSLLAGAVLGKRIRFRSLAILSSILILAGGCIPAFLNRFESILIFRAILGLGIGMQAPLENALVMGLYEGEQRAAVFGYGTLCMNAGGIIMQFLGGALASVSWQAAFLGHAFTIIALIMSFFIPEPDASHFSGNVSEHNPETGNSRSKIPSTVFLIAFILFLYNLSTNTVLITISQLFEMRNAGGAVAAGLSLSLYTLAGCLAGIIFGKLFQKAARWTLAAGYFLCGSGASLIYFGKTAIPMTAGLFLMGFGFAIIFPAIMAWTGMITPPEAAGVASSIVLAFMNLGAFVGSFWLILLSRLFQNGITGNLIIDIFLLFAVGILFLIRSPFRKTIGTHPAKTD